MQCSELLFIFFFFFFQAEDGIRDLTVTGVQTCALPISQQIGGAVLALVATGGGMMMLTTASNTALQTLVEDDKRGRVMSLYTMAFMGMAPVGSALAGSVAAQIGAPQTVRLGGGCCFGGA